MGWQLTVLDLFSAYLLACGLVFAIWAGHQRVSRLEATRLGDDERLLRLDRVRRSRMIVFAVLGLLNAGLVVVIYLVLPNPFS